MTWENERTFRCQCPRRTFSLHTFADPSSVAAFKRPRWSRGVERSGRGLAEPGASATWPLTESTQTPAGDRKAGWNGPEIALRVFTWVSCWPLFQVALCVSCGGAPATSTSFHLHEASLQTAVGSELPRRPAGRRYSGKSRGLRDHSNPRGAPSLRTQTRPHGEGAVDGQPHSCPQGCRAAPVPSGLHAAAHANPSVWSSCP